MPMAAALVASAFSISGGMAAIGAVGATVGQTILGGMMVAGGALSGIGAITGNSKLMKIGGVLGLAGGVGNLISKGLETAAGGAATEAAQNAAKSTVGNTIADSTGSAVGASEAAKAAASTAGDLGVFNDAGGGMIAGAGGPAPAMGTPIAGADPYAAGSGWGGDTLKAMGATNDTAAKFSDKFYGAINNALPGVGSTAKTLVDGAKSVIGDVSSWAEANPNTAKLASGVVGGAMQYASQTEAMKQQMAQKKKYDDWVRQRYNDSVANLRIPAPFSTPGQQPGIIAGSRG